MKDSPNSVYMWEEVAAAEEEEAILVFQCSVAAFRYGSFVRTEDHHLPRCLRGPPFHDCHPTLLVSFWSLTKVS